MILTPDRFGRHGCPVIQKFKNSHFQSVRIFSEEVKKKSRNIFSIKYLQNGQQIVVGYGQLAPVECNCAAGVLLNLVDDVAKVLFLQVLVKLALRGRLENNFIS